MKYYKLFHWIIFPSIIQKMFNNQTITLISYASKAILKILQARLQQFQMFNLDLEKAEEPEINVSGPEKHLYLLHWLHQSSWLCESQQTVANS